MFALPIYWKWLFIDLVHAGDALLGVDEEPLPVERDDLDFERPGLRLRGDRLKWMELVRSDPDAAAEKHDDEDRDGPDQELEAARMDEVRPALRARVVGAEPPREGKCRNHRRHPDHAHDANGVEEDDGVGGADRSLRLQDAARAPGERKGRNRHENAPGKRSTRKIAVVAGCARDRTCVHKATRRSSG